MMNNINLNDYGVAEMQAGEMVEINGGILPLVAAGVALLVLAGCTNTNEVKVTVQCNCKCDCQGTNSSGSDSTNVQN